METPSENTSYIGSMEPTSPSSRPGRRFQIVVDEDDLRLLKEAIEIKMRLNIGQINDAFNELPIEHNKLYSTDRFKDWTLTIGIIRQLISQFTKSNVDGWTSSLSIFGDEVKPSCRRSYHLYEKFRKALGRIGEETDLIECLTPGDHPAIVDEATNS